MRDPRRPAASANGVAEHAAQRRASSLSKLPRITDDRGGGSACAGGGPASLGRSRGNRPTRRRRGEDAREVTNWR